MSKYTTEVRYICEASAGLTESKGFNDINTILTNCINNVFNFDFPIFDESYRGVLERKILKHYYTREIATETVGLWKHFLDMRLNEIMPYYNKLYQSELLNFNPLYDVDITTSYEKTGTSSEDARSTVTRTDNLSRVSTDGGTDQRNGSNVDKNTRWDIYSDTPQGSLQNVQNETYLTNARKITDDGTGSTYNETNTYGKTNTTLNTGTQANEGTGLTDIETTEEYLQHVTGKNGGASYSKLIQEYRNTFLNIDMMIINELSDLFFGLW